MAANAQITLKKTIKDSRALATVDKAEDRSEIGAGIGLLILMSQNRANLVPYLETSDEISLALRQLDL